MAGVGIARLDRGARRSASHQAGVIRNVEISFLFVRIVAGAASLTQDGSEMVVVGDLLIRGGRGEDLYKQYECGSACRRGSQKTLAYASGYNRGQNNLRRLSRHQ
jgi:hypothetical protein